MGLFQGSAKRRDGDKSCFEIIGKGEFWYGRLKLFGDCEGILGDNHDVKNSVSYLDKLFITPRYPDAFAEGSPWELPGRPASLDWSRGPETSLRCSQIVK